MSTLSVNAKNSLWVEKFRPQTIDETILPQNIKDMFKNYVKSGNFPNLLLHGDTGVGKTSLGEALAKELGWSIRFFNASAMRSADFFGDLTKFVTTKSLDNPSNIKIVFLDEVDGLKGDLQSNMKYFMEEHSHVCRFIMTANLPAKLIKPLRSRCTEISFYWSPEDLKELKKEFGKRCIQILKHEGIQYDAPTIVQIINRDFPDFRKVLNEFQKYSAINGKIDESILLVQTATFDDLYTAFKSKKFKDVRAWVANNKNLGDMIFTVLLNDGLERIEPQSIPDFVTSVGEWAYRYNFVSDPEIVFTSCFTEILRKVQWK